MDQHQRQNTVIWLYSVCALIFFMVIVGGITRLTHSGLSMVDWKPIMGTVPPLSEAEWQDVFDAYRQYPEYQKINKGMSLSEFKGIFFWEYLHRLLGRLIGVVFLAPFLVFYFKKYYDSAMAKKLFIGFLLGGLQGLLGWYMVKSGLVDRPSVSHYRLAAHLSLALLIFAYLFWLTMDIKREGRSEVAEKSPFFRKSLWVTGAVSLQIIFGAFVAGKKAGIGYNTFPKMGEDWVPDAVFFLDPLWVNFFENNAGIQFAHRTIAWLLLILIPALLYYFKAEFTDLRKTRAAQWVVAALAVQFLLGVATIVMVVPVHVAATHQAGAVVLLAAALNLNHAHASRGSDTIRDLTRGNASYIHE